MTGLFALAWFVMIAGLALFFRSASLRAPLSRSARPLAWELVPGRYLPLGVAGLIAMVLIR